MVAVVVEAIPMATTSTALLEVANTVAMGMCRINHDFKPHVCPTLRDLCRRMAAEI